MLKLAVPVLTLLLLCCRLAEQSAIAQSNSGMIITIGKEPKGTFTFIKKWAYPW